MDRDTSAVNHSYTIPANSQTTGDRPNIYNGENINNSLDIPDNGQPVIIFGDVYLGGHVPPWMSTLYIIINILILIFGPTGNLIIIIIYHRTKPKSACDWFILFIAYMDFTVCLFFPWFNLKIELRWRVAGDMEGLICGIESLINFSAMLCSCFLLSLMAFERYTKVCRPTIASLTGDTSKLICYGVIPLSIGLCFYPSYLYFVEQDCFVLLRRVPLGYTYCLLGIFCTCFIIVTFSYANVIRTIELKIKVKQRLLSHDGLRDDNTDKVVTGKDAGNADVDADHCDDIDDDLFISKSITTSTFQNLFCKICRSSRNKKTVEIKRDDIANVKVGKMKHCKAKAIYYKDDNNDNNDHGDGTVRNESKPSPKSHSIKTQLNQGEEKQVDQCAKTNRQSTSVPGDDDCHIDQDGDYNLPHTSNNGRSRIILSITSPEQMAVLPGPNDTLQPSELNRDTGLKDIIQGASENTNQSIEYVLRHDYKQLDKIQYHDAGEIQISSQSSEIPHEQNLPNIHPHCTSTCSNCRNDNDNETTNEKRLPEFNETEMSTSSTKNDSFKTKPDTRKPLNIGGNPSETLRKMQHLKLKAQKSDESYYDDDLYSDIQPVSFFLRRAKEKMYNIQPRVSRKKSKNSSSCHRRTKWMKERRMALMLISITFVFLFSWIPPWALLLCFILDHQPFESHIAVRLAYRYWEKMTLLQYCSNFIIYYTFNPGFRNKVKALIKSSFEKLQCKTSKSVDLRQAQTV